MKRWWVRKGLSKYGGSVPGFALNTNDNNGVNVNRDDDDSDNLGASSSRDIDKLQQSIQGRLALNLERIKVWFIA